MLKKCHSRKLLWIKELYSLNSAEINNVGSTLFYWVPYEQVLVVHNLLCPVLDSPLQKGCGHTEASPVKGRGDDYGHGGSHVQGEAERWDWLSSERDSSRPWQCVSILDGGGKEGGVRIFLWCIEIGQEAMSTNSKIGNFFQNVRKSFYSEGGQTW